MKSEKGVTLTSLIIYVVVATILISSIALFSSFCFSNMNLIKDQDIYAPEFNKFNMFFIEDIKKNRTATIDDNHTKITLADGTIYEYKQVEKAIYRNNTKITERVQEMQITSNEEKVANTTKQIISVYMSIGKEKNFSKQIDYVLKYW